MAVSRTLHLFTLPWEIQEEIYGKLEGRDLINLHLAFPTFTPDLAPFYHLKSRFDYNDDDLWPVIRFRRVPNLIEEDLIHAAYKLTLKLRVISLKAFNGISDGLRCKVTELSIFNSTFKGRPVFNQRLVPIIRILNRS